MDTPEQQAYCGVMEEVKQRIEVVDQLADPHALRSLPERVRLESAYLQYRKIIEQIAFGSLISNREAFARVYKRFSKYWNAADLLRDLARVNPDFYPQPLREERSTNPKVKAHLVPKSGGYLTKGELLELYNRSGDILHERNPFAGTADLSWHREHLGEWRNKLVQLLDQHMIKLVGHEGFYLLQMNSGGTGRVVCYEFMPSAPP